MINHTYEEKNLSNSSKKNKLNKRKVVFMKKTVDTPVSRFFIDIIFIVLILYSLYYYIDLISSILRVQNGGYAEIYKSTNILTEIYKSTNISIEKTIFDFVLTEIFLVTQYLINIICIKMYKRSKDK